MDLWIRSKDRETLLKANRIDVQEKTIIVYDNDYHCNETYMGTYKTKERALEILDEIQRHLVVINDKKYNYFCVYEMPEE